MGIENKAVMWYYIPVKEHRATARSSSSCWHRVGIFYLVSVIDIEGMDDIPDVLRSQC